MQGKISRMRFVLVLPFALILQVAIANRPARADDWPGWGGPKRDLVWRETGIVEKLPSGLLPRVWSTPIAEGYSGPAVANGRVYITDRQHEKQNERVLCLDAETGKNLWTHEYRPPRYSISYPAGPRSTPEIHDGRVYTIGAMGQMFCFDEKTGGVLWSKDFVNDFKTKLPIWGMAASPLIDGDQVIMLVGGENALVVSLDKATGRERWRALDDPEVGYSPPVIFTINGKRQLIVWHPRSITGLDPADRSHLVGRSLLGESRPEHCHAAERRRPHLCDVVLQRPANV